MGYVAVGILFLLIASAFITYLVVTATRRNSPARAKDPTAGDRHDDTAPGIGPDHTPLGDTAEHAGQQTGAGETVGGQDAGPSGGTGRPRLDADETGPGHEHDTPQGRFKRDPIGGEAEGKPAVEAHPPRP